jgi:heme-degrading monooxygenase HmoA
MIAVGMNCHVIPGKQQDFEQKFAAVIDALNAANGHSASTLWQDVADDASYLIASEWSEEQAFLDFIHSRAFKDVTTCAARSRFSRAARSTRFTSIRRRRGRLT